MTLARPNGPTGPVDVLASPRGVATAIGTVLLLLATQLSVAVPNPFSVAGSKNLNLAEVPLLAIAALVAGWVLLRGGWRRLSRLGRYLVVASALLALAWVALVMVRWSLTGRLVVSVTVLENMLLGVALALFVELARLRALPVAVGVLAFLAGCQAWAVSQVLGGETVRRMGLLGNINYFVGLCLMVVPFCVAVAIRSGRGWLKVATAVVVGGSAALVLLSGSRFGGSATLLMLVLTVVVVDGRRWRRRLVGVALALATGALLFGVLTAANDDQLKDVARTFNVGSVVRGEEPDLADIEAQHRVNPVEQPPLTERDRFTTAGDPDHEPPPDGVNVVTHTRVRTRSLAVLQEHWLLGIGRTGPYFSGWGYQPAHNIVLEVLLYLGVLGAPFWFAVMLAGVVGAWRVGDRKAWLLGFCGLLGFSLFQPLLTDSVVTMSAMWLLLGAARAPKEPGSVSRARPGTA